MWGGVVDGVTVAVGLGQLPIRKGMCNSMIKIEPVSGKDETAAAVASYKFIFGSNHIGL